MVEILSILSIPMVFLIVFGFLAFKKHLQHKQIMAAIEKGTPLSEIMPPKPKPAGPAWIKFVSTGTMLIIIGISFTLFNPMDTNHFGMSVFMILLGVGVGMLVRGLLHRKYYLKNEISANNNSTEKEKNL